MKIDREDIGVLVIWGVVICLCIGAVLFGFQSAIEAVSKIVVAIIGATAVIIGAILTHALTKVREIRMEQRRQMQENYKELVSKIADFIRSLENKDLFETIHLYSWVVGSPETIIKTQEFMLKRSIKNLESLLFQMRLDLQLERTPATLNLKQILKPEVTEKPGLLDD